MAVFTYQGRGSAGAMTGEIEAADRTPAVGELRRRAILVTKINEKSGGKTKAKAGGKVKDKEMAIFTRQFSTMIDAGLRLVQCLSILAEQSESKNLRDVTSRVPRSVEQGSTLAHALRGPPPRSHPPCWGSGGGELTSIRSSSAPPPISRRPPP